MELATTTHSDESRPTDEQILEFEQSIKDVEALSRPLISPLLPLSDLICEYEHGSASMLAKLTVNCPSHISPLFTLQALADNFVAVQRARGDGNCFYRALGFGLFQHIASTADSVLIDRLKQSKDILIAAGFEDVAVSDFYSVVIDVLNDITAEHSSSKRNEKLLEFFNDPSTSNSIVVHLRFVASAYIRLNAEMYAAFLLDSSVASACPSEGILHWVNANVEAFGVEADEVQIAALTSALRVTAVIAYLSANESSEVTSHAIGDESSTCKVDLLYRPGHYDLLISKSK